jgi:hypothetical protein
MITTIKSCGSSKNKEANKKWSSNVTGLYLDSFLAKQAWTKLRPGQASGLMGYHAATASGPEDFRASEGCAACASEWPIFSLCSVDRTEAFSLEKSSNHAKFSQRVYFTSNLSLTVNILHLAINKWLDNGGPCEVIV